MLWFILLSSSLMACPRKYSQDFQVVETFMKNLPQFSDFFHSLLLLLWNIGCSAELNSWWSHGDLTVIDIYNVFMYCGVYKGFKKILHMGDTVFLDRCLYKHRYREKKFTRFFLLWGIWLSEGGLLCTLQHSPGLYFYSLNYTALLSYAVHFNEKF